MNLKKFDTYRMACISRQYMGALAAAFLLAFSLTSAGLADSKDKREKEKRNASEESDVKNFGKINDHIYRGGQPKEREYRELAAIGIKTVIDLREDAEGFARTQTEQAGMKYVNIRLNSKRPPTQEESSFFLQMVGDQTNWPVFVHCAGGRHRTGVLLAVYRMEMDGWSPDQAYHEMKDFKFYSSRGHGDMKEYVFDYYRQMQDRRALPASMPAATRSRRVTQGN